MSSTALTLPPVMIPTFGSCHGVVYCLDTASRDDAAKVAHLSPRLAAILVLLCHIAIIVVTVVTIVIVIVVAGVI